MQASANESVDLYDDVVADGNSSNGDVNPTPGPGTNSDGSELAPNHTPNAANGPSNIPIKRFQLYVGNLTWVLNESTRIEIKGLCLYNISIFDFLQWTSDQDITDAVHDIGVNDFLDVKFFENRVNGQSKGFCVISLASEAIMRLCMDRLPKKKLNGQCPVVTYTTMEALNQVYRRFAYSM